MSVTSPTFKSVDVVLVNQVEIFTNKSRSQMLINGDVLYFYWRHRKLASGLFTKPQLHDQVNYVIIWDKVFKKEPSKICGRQPLKNLK